MKKIFTLLLSFLSCSIYAQVPGGDMENWHNYTADTASLQAPDNWYGSDEATFLADTGGLFSFLISPAQQIFQTGNAHTGNRGARIESLPILVNGSFFTGALSTAKLTYAGLLIPQGGMPVSGLITFVNAWVMYISASGDDTASLVVTARQQGTQVGSVTVDIPPTAAYEQISAAIQYTDINAVPDSLQITFYSSKNMLGGADTSKLWVDDVTISTTSVNQTIKKDVVKIYPNPSSGIVSIYNSLSEPLTIEAFTATGQKVTSKEFIGNDIIDLASMPSGMYFYKVSNQKGEQVQHGKLAILK